MIEQQMVDASGRPLLRVAILLAEATDRQTDYMVDLVDQGGACGQSLGSIR
jgi:hypothetical protein